MAIVVNFGTEAIAYQVPDLQREVLFNDVVAGVPIVVLTDPRKPDSWVVCSRMLDDRTVTLAVEGDLIVDVETNSVWHPVTGVALSGPLEGEQLDVLPAFTSFALDFFTFFPDGHLWPSTE